MRNIPKAERPAPAAPRDQSPRARAREPEQPTTLSQFARSQADEIGGRFAPEQKQTVTGTAPTQQWPELPSTSPWHGEDPVGLEPPTGVRIDDLNSSPEPAGSLHPFPPQHPGGAPSASPGDDVAAPPSFSDADDDGGPPDDAA